MIKVLLVVHLLIALALIGVILLQRSEGGALGIGGGGGGFMSGRSAANVLTRTTAILAGCFFATSLALALLANQKDKPKSIMETAPVKQEAPAAPVAPAQPAAPVGK